MKHTNEKNNWQGIPRAAVTTRQENRQTIFLIIVDLMLGVFSYLLGGYLWMHLYHNLALGQILQLYDTQMVLFENLPVILILYLAASLLFDVESEFIRRSTAKVAWASVKSGVILLLSEALVVFARIRAMVDASRGMYLCIAAVNAGLFFLVHIILRYYLLKVRRNGKNVPQMFLVTTTDRLNQILRECAGDRNHRLCAIAVLDEDQIGRSYTIADQTEDAHADDTDRVADAIPVVATYENMFSYVQSHVVDEVYINVPWHTGHSTLRAAMEFEKMGVTVHVSIEPLNDFEGSLKSIGVVGAVPVITFSEYQYDWRMLALKRLMDIAGGLVGLLITAVATIFLAIPLLVESPGPLFFGQNRVGKNGRIFRMYKFRSMYQDAEERKKELMAKNEMDGPMFKVKDDPRITKVGKFIRTTSIDELPQFWNVLKGDMSLVGTRPPTVDEFEQYEASQKRRLSARPGITGLWQVSGRNDISDFEDVVKLDLEYIDNWSLWLDVKILFKTLTVVLKRGGE